MGKFFQAAIILLAIHSNSHANDALDWLYSETCQKYTEFKSTAARSLPIIHSSLEFIENHNEEILTVGTVSLLTYGLVKGYFNHLLENPLLVLAYWPD